MLSQPQLRGALDAVNNKTPGVTASGAVLGRARRIVQMRKDSLLQQIPVTVMMLGKIAFVGFGGEPFTYYAKAVAAACPDVTVLSACCCNGYEGYLPTVEEYDRPDSYEGNSTPFPRELMESCINMAVRLIQAVKK